MAIIAAVATAVALPSLVALGRLFRSQLFGVSTFDPLTLCGAVILTVLMLCLAAGLPARRAAGVEPMRALRSE
jgi:putative ABC transport system permease protein